MSSPATSGFTISYPSVPEIQPGSQLPISAPVKEKTPVDSFPFETLTGKNVIVAVPGAFTGICSKQIPVYIKDYDKYKEKGVNDIFVLAVNDVFALEAWKTDMAPAGTPIRFIADDRGAFAGALGLLFDATVPRLGTPRAKRFVLITEGTEVKQVIVGDLDKTASEVILPLV